MTTVKILGTSDDNTTCDCCGKTHLKKTVVLEINEAVVYYGVDCATRALTGSKKNNKVVDTKATAIQLAKKWQAKGYDLETIGKGIWNRFGFLYSVKNNTLYISDFGVIN